MGERDNRLTEKKKDRQRDKERYKQGQDSDRDRESPCRAGGVKQDMGCH